MNHYKSWSYLNKQLQDFLCDDLKGRVSYFLTRYHNVHNSYGRAAVLLDGTEKAAFSWVNMYEQDSDLSSHYVNESDEACMRSLKQKWNENCTYCDMDFLAAATDFLQMPIDAALVSESHIIRIFAILDRRVGKRTLHKIASDGQYLSLPSWLRQFYDLRIGLIHDPAN